MRPDRGFAVFAEHTRRHDQQQRCGLSAPCSQLLGCGWPSRTAARMRSTHGLRVGKGLTPSTAEHAVAASAGRPCRGRPAGLSPRPAPVHCQAWPRPILRPALASTSARIRSSARSSVTVRGAAAVTVGHLQLHRCAAASAACVTCQRRSVKRLHVLPVVPPPRLAMARTQSPLRRPARSARLPATGGPSRALGSSMPIQCAAAYSSTASSRLANGPAATMLARAATRACG